MSTAAYRMNLLELIEEHRNLFYRQTWMLGEAFMRVLPDDDAMTIPPRRLVRTGQAPKSGDGLPRAVDLAHAYVLNPDDPIWLRYLWTADTDKYGQRVYMGVNDGKMELHRHIHLTERFGVPTWR